MVCFIKTTGEDNLPPRCSRRSVGYSTFVGCCKNTLFLKKTKKLFVRYNSDNFQSLIIRIVSLFAWCHNYIYYYSVFSLSSKSAFSLSSSGTSVLKYLYFRTIKTCDLYRFVNQTNRCISRQKNSIKSGACNISSAFFPTLNPN